jgi:predicted outer membrane repeat protein
MRPRVIATVVAALLPTVLAAAFAHATTITVASDGSGMFTQIQVGLDAASSGDTVSVAAGNYEGPENRDLDFGGKAITLIGPAGWNATRILCGDLGRGFFFHGGEDTTAVVQGLSVMQAAADSGAGAFCRNGSSPRFIDCRFEINEATERGGAICCVASSPVIRECRFIENEAWDGSYPYGGALACLSGSAPLVADCYFETNLGQKGGGAVYCNSSPATFARCEFFSNQLGTYGNSGACMTLSNSDGASVTGCTLRENGTNTTGVGGGIYAGSTDVTIADCRFIANRAGAGAGIHFTSASSGTVTGCVFAENDSEWSAAAGVSCFQNSNLLISGCTFVHNRDYHLVFQDSSPTVEYCILAFTTYQGAMQCQSGTETPDIHHCFVYDNVGAHGDTVCGGNDHDIEYADPCFCGFMSGDYWLCEDSPCRAGATWPTQVGAYPAGCDPCGSPVEPVTWGTLKALFR